MVKNDNAHAARLYESLARHAGEQEAERFALQYPLSPSASIEKRFAWAKDVCTELEATFDRETVRAIRVDCRCGPPDSRIAPLRKLYQTCGDLSEFVEKMNAKNGGFTVETDGEALYLVYPTCYCSCVKRVEGALPRAWCDCTLGYAKRMFGGILGKEVEVELLKSVKRGDDACRVKITCEG